MSVDINKVISGMECCSGTAIYLGYCPENCPYLADCERSDKCVEKLHSDALAILKPRVLTLEEVANYLGYPVWIEEKYFDVVYCEVLFDVDGRAFGLTLGKIEFGNVLTGHSTISIYSYGKTFRFWNFKPTDEDRRRIPWG